MPRGGFRPGAGRPKGGGKRKATLEAKREAHKLQISPLEYMLKVMNDPEEDDARRDRMAMAAAPFVHMKPSERALGKKAQAQEEAETAGEGTEWGDDLSLSLKGLN